MKLSRLETPATSTEVDFYHKVARAMPAPPMVRCYDAFYSTTQRAYHLLLEDVSATHRMAFDEYPMAPRVEDVERIIDALADLHAYWWDDSRLDGEIAELPDEKSIRDYVAHHEQGLPGIIDAMGDRLSERRKSILEDVFSYHPQVMMDRARVGRN